MCRLLHGVGECRAHLPSAVRTPLTLSDVRSPAVATAAVRTLTVCSPLPLPSGLGRAGSGDNCPPCAAAPCLALPPPPVFPLCAPVVRRFSLALFPLALGGRLFQPVAARRLAAVVAILGELRLQFSDLGAQALDNLPLFADNG